MSGSEELENTYGFCVNPNIIRPQDTAIGQAGLHHDSAAKPGGARIMSRSVVIQEVGYVQPIEPHRIFLPPRITDETWDDRPA